MFFSINDYFYSINEFGAAILLRFSKTLRLHRYGSNQGVTIFNSCRTSFVTENKYTPVNVLFINILLFMVTVVWRNLYPNCVRFTWPY